MVRKSRLVLLAIASAFLIAPAAGARVDLCRNMHGPRGNQAEEGWYAVSCFQSGVQQYGVVEAQRHPATLATLVSLRVNETAPCQQLACQSATFPVTGPLTAVRGVPSSVWLPYMPESMAITCSCFDDEE